MGLGMKKDSPRKDVTLDDLPAAQGGILQRAVAAVRRTQPTDANASRLWAKYMSVCKEQSRYHPNSCAIGRFTATGR